MLDKYLDLNHDARDFFILYLDKNVKDEEKYKRCRNEVELLFDKGILFMVEYLYKYNKEAKYDGMCFRGMANNLLLLYELGLSKVDPIKYNLPYELFTDKSFDIEFLNYNSLDFVSSMEKNGEVFRIIKGHFEETDDDAINECLNDHYLIIPSMFEPINMQFRLNEYNQFETVEDYSLFTNDFLTFKLTDKPIINEKEVDLTYALNSKFEKELELVLNPRDMDDYVKIISLAHSTHVWKNNQDKLFKEGKIDKKNIISSREDIYEYLINHKIEKVTALDIVRQVVIKRTDEWHKLWQKYKGIMKEHNCDDMFIDILSNIIYISGRGYAISECLYALDADNYVMEDL